MGASRDRRGSYDKIEPAVLLFTTYSCSACEEIKEYLKDLLEEKDFVS